jgi:predicted lipoprotein with Yx(FWY)xxD motif
MSRTRHLQVPAAALGVVGALTLAACGGGGYGGGGGMGSAKPTAKTPSTTTATTVTTARSASLGRSVLVSAGHTLYALSAETKGHFVCTSNACLATWSPLTVPAGRQPQGMAGLGTIVRPGGARQVTFRGQPLYTFAQDSAPGDSKGEGFRDVGTWHAVTAAAATTSAPKPAPKPAPAPTSQPSGGGGGYGY